ncbi:hypothetical protein FGADI_11514 [Fusarium gaditjirri]|uniref:Glycoside hydrolase family 5 domain-containing protein n=1 Tax=Fusarium gaditjirri TaxID=282569 RepID=A0A8H4WQC7_9HYPO|nr:hypothetical protein FGADI_11514 [Fusarium gaditjirri]
MQYSCAVSMLMENFMNGFPGREHQFRAALLKVLGQEKHDFFDKFLEYFFGEKDAKFLPAPNTVSTLSSTFTPCLADWHSDNPTGYTAFWDHKHFQDRAINLWEHIARRYKGNPWVAGYNPMNEPAGSEWSRLLAFYDRIVPAIRNVDPDHILFLEGNMVWDNSVYAIHYYCGFGFPNRLGRIKGTKEQESYIRRMYDRKVEFMKKHNVPIWNDEFGPIYERKEYNPDWDVQNQERYNMLDRQMAIYTSESIDSSAWSIWSYKDVNVMGMTHVSPDSAWLKLLGPIIKKKRDIAVDSWAYDDAHLQDGLFGPLHRWFEDNVPAQ